MRLMSQILVVSSLLFFGACEKKTEPAPAKAAPAKAAPVAAAPKAAQKTVESKPQPVKPASQPVNVKNAEAANPAPGCGPQGKEKRTEGLLKDGKKEGVWTHWHDNKTKKIDEHFKAGKLEGKRTT